MEDFIALSFSPVRLHIDFLEENLVLIFDHKFMTITKQTIR